MTLTLFKQTTEMGEVRKENRELELKLATIRRSIDAEVTRERDYVEEIAELTQENKGLQKKCKQDVRLGKRRKRQANTMFPVTEREKVHKWMWLSAGGGTLEFWGESKGGGWASIDRAITTH